MGSLPNLHELGGKEAGGRPGRRCQPLARVPTAPAQHQRVYKSKSNGHAANHVNDDLILDVSAYSPISGRCTRSVRRRDSLSSSIGATSVRRLINTVGRSTRRPPLGDRQRATRALLALCTAHALSSAALLPFLALQSTWAPPSLAAALFLSAALAALLSPLALQHYTPALPLLAFHLALVCFYSAHLLPMLALLVPVYVTLGLCVGVGSVGRIAGLLHIVARLTQEEEHRVTLLRRAARALHFAHDLGLIFGSAVTASVMSLVDINKGNMTIVIMGNSSGNWTDEAVTDVGMFIVDDAGERVCGAQACPRGAPLEPVSQPLVAVFSGLAVLGLAAAGVHAVLRPRDWHEPRPGPPALRAVMDSYKDFKLQLAAPLAVFIGMEQAFMFTDFAKSYVVCTLGIERVPLVFVSQGLLQSIAAATLSMLLRSIQRRRCLVVAVGLAFHACLLLVQLVWKPSGDDPALFYVISAAWGVCHAIWEQLNWTLLTGAYADNTPAAITAFANSLAWRHVGTAVVFAAHGLVCVRAQLHTLAAALLLAALPAAALEQRLHNLRKLRSISRL